MTNDRIEKSIKLNAPQARVWRALTNAKEFGEWFHVALEGAFAPGATVQGHILETGYEHMVMELFIEQIVPERLFSYRWHPYAIEADHDYSAEPTTLVEFHLAPVAGGTQLTVVESGFDQIPAERRDEAFRMNTGGWAAQMSNIERYVSA